MKNTLKLTLCAAILILGSTNAWADYKEVMDPAGLTKNLKVDFGLVDDGAKADQSETVQRAIDDVGAAGGGRIIMPVGTYRFARVYLKSNVHLLIEKDTVIRPVWAVGEKTVVFLMDTQATDKDDRSFIENVSIRGLGGPFIVDYSDWKREESGGIRAILCKMVRNFLIADLEVRDNFSTYCGVTLTPTRTRIKDISDWEVTRATDGTMRNCRIINASPGYGLVQLHGARSIHFEDLYARGGVTLRLETGALGEHTAVFDISAKNIVCENGRSAVMLGPHSAVNGIVHVDGVTARSCAYAVSIGLGGVKKQELARNPEATNGRFADGCSIKNIRAIFGRDAQIKTHVILAVPKAYYDDLRFFEDPKFFIGPSIGAVKDSTEGGYRVDIDNITLEGFTHNADKKILTPADTRPGKWHHELRQWKADRGIEEE